MDAYAGSVKDVDCFHWAWPSRVSKQTCRNWMCTSRMGRALLAGLGGGISGHDITTLIMSKLHTLG